MIPRLEQLEDRLLLDAELAVAYETQVVPIMLQQRAVYDATLTQQADKMLTVAASQVSLLGLQSNPQAVSSLQNLSVQVQAALANADAYFVDNMQTTYDLALSFPPFAGEDAAINQLAAFYLSESPLPVSQEVP